MKLTARASLAQIGTCAVHLTKHAASSKSSQEIKTNLHSSILDGRPISTMEDSAWGTKKFDYYYTDYVDKDYPSKLTAKEERSAAVEEEEGRRIQKRLLSTLDDFELNLESEDDDQGDDLIESLEKANQNATIEVKKKCKRVKFEPSDEEDVDDDDDDGDDDDEDDESGDEDKAASTANGRQRRPINMAIQKNRGLTPYKKKEFRNPRVKHKMKYKKAMSKRNRNVREAQPEYNRYSGETTGIKTSTVKSIKLC